MRKVDPHIIATTSRLRSAIRERFTYVVILSENEKLQLLMRVRTVVPGRNPGQVIKLYPISEDRTTIFNPSKSGRARQKEDDFAILMNRTYILMTLGLSDERPASIP
jgi:hypothetical protein